MDDLTGKLNEILNNPQAMEQVSALAGMLGLGSDQAAPASSAPKEAPQSNPAPAASPLSALGNLGNLGNLGALGSLSGLGSLLGGGASGGNGEMLQAVTKLLPLLNQFQQEDDHTRFLRALRPLLGDERRKKLDESIRIMQMLRLLPLLKKEGIL